jgi:S1-C subfamily serine protease
VEVPAPTAAQTYRCPLCHAAFMVGGSVPVAAPVAAPVRAKPRAAAPAQPASSSAWMWGWLIYAGGLAVLALFVLRPMLQNRAAPGAGAAATVDDVSTYITKSTAAIDTVIKTQHARNQAQADRIKQGHKNEALARLEAELAGVKWQRSVRAAEFAQLWFDGDRSVGEAMVDVWIQLYVDAIATHHDATPGNEVRVGGEDFDFARIWEGMRANRRLSEWMAAHRIVEDIDFWWRLLVKSQGARGGGALPAFLAELKPDSTGTGFWIAPDGWLITNHHVVDQAKSIDVRTAAGKTVPARVVHQDAARDLSLLKVDASSAEWLPLSSGQAAQGVEVFTQGFPNVTVQGLAVKYSDGKISSLSGINDDEKLYQISVPVQPGNSGGALIHSRDGMAWVVGVVSGKLAAHFDAENVNYAIKSTVVRSFLGDCPEGRAILAAARPEVPADSPVEHARKASCLVLVKKG